MKTEIINQREKQTPLFKRSIETNDLSNFLAQRGFAVNEDPLTYPEISKIMGGRNPQGDARGILSSAMKIVRREHNFHYATIQNVGIKLILKTTDSVKHQIIRGSRAMKKGIEIGKCQDDKYLTPIEKDRHRNLMIHSQILLNISRMQSTKAIEYLQESKKMIPPPIEMFKR